MAPTVSKRERRAWTTDDLMRMQENREPPRKRHRLDMSPEVAESNWLDECEDTDDEALPAGDDLPLDDVYDDEESQSGSPEQDDTPSNVLSRLDTGARPGIRPAPAHDSLPPGLQVEKLAVPAPPSFSALGISPPLQAALASMSIRTPTPVQAACIPPLLSGTRAP
jgi:ATP-dependent RNA helicase DDX49/DBP8